MDSTPTPNSDEPDAPHTGPSRRSIVIAVVAVLAVVGAVIAGVALTSGDDDAGTATPPATTARAGDESPNGRVTTTTSHAQRLAAEARQRAEQRAREREEDRKSSTTRPGVPGPGNTNGNPGSTTVPARGGTPTTRTPDTVSPTVEAAYAQAYTQACRDIWSIADADGVLVDADDEDGRTFVVADCQNLYDSMDVFFYDTVEEARAGGVEDASWNLSFELVGNTLRNTSGTRSRVIS